MAQTRFTIMELSQGQIIQKPNKQLSSLFMTHHLNVKHAPVKFHKLYIPYGLGVIARMRFTI